MRSKRSKAWHQRKDIQRARLLIEHGDRVDARVEKMRWKSHTRAVILNEKWMVKVEHEI